MCFPQSLLASWTDLHPSIYRTLWIPHGVTRLLELPQLPVGKGGVHPAQVDRLLHSLSISGCKKRSKKPLWLIWKCSACLPLYCAAFVKQSNQCDRIQMSFISTVSFFINKENYHIGNGTPLLQTLSIQIHWVPLICHALADQLILICC